MRVPVVLVTGVDPTAMSAVTVGLQWDLPSAVAVQHRIDPERQVLHRIVSDMTGVLDREEITLVSPARSARTSSPPSRGAPATAAGRR
jgi:hypothetical protein